MAKRSSTKRELIDTGRDKSYAKRDVQGRFKEMDDVGRSLATDRRRQPRRRWRRGTATKGIVREQPSRSGSRLQIMVRSERSTFHRPFADRRQSGRHRDAVEDGSGDQGGPGGRRVGASLDAVRRSSYLAPMRSPR